MRRVKKGSGIHHDWDSCGSNAEHEHRESSRYPEVRRNSRRLSPRVASNRQQLICTWLYAALLNQQRATERIRTSAVQVDCFPSGPTLPTECPTHKRPRIAAIGDQTVRRDGERIDETAAFTCRNCHVGARGSCGVVSTTIVLMNHRQRCRSVFRSSYDSARFRQRYTSNFYMNIVRCK
jgi:hypothetical protein